MSHNQSDTIDAVVTWVDGNDPKHQQKRINALLESKRISTENLSTGELKTRFIDNGELKFCITSIRKFAPWIRYIYLVTDNQAPDFLDDEFIDKYKVKVVDHKEIFQSYESALPTFNSRTIETAIWRIPGLAEKFIYFNDDFVLTSPLQKEHFFKNGNVVIRGRWRRMGSYGKWRMQFNHIYSKTIKKFLGITYSMHLLYQIRSAQLADFDNKYYYVPHVPHPVRKSTIATFFEKNPDLFKKNIQYKFRDTDQFSAMYLAYHLEIANKKAELVSPDKALMINGEMDFSGMLNRKIKAIKDEKNAFLCIQGMEKVKPKQKKYLMRTLSTLTELD
jgi:hypothetical protein